MKFASTLLVSASFLALGCGSTSSGGVANNNNASAGGSAGMSAGPTGTGGDISGGGGSSSSSVSGQGGATPQGSTSYTLQFGPITVNPLQENTQCVVLRLKNAGQIHVGTFHNLLGTSSHHMIVYRVNDTTEQTTPFDCQPFTDTLDPTKGSTLMISQKLDDTLQLPPGVGYTLDDNQMIRLEMHYINATMDPVTLVSTSTMTTVPDAMFTDEADFLFIGDADINIPAHASKQLGPIFFKLPAVYQNVNFFAMTGHEHKMGTNVTVNLASSKDDPGTPIYDVPKWLWSEPKTVDINPTIQVPQYGGFTFTCNWNNTSDQPIKFGESANDEMCFFWAYYYPSNGNGAKVCFHTDQTATPTDVCCPGNTLCNLVDQFLGVGSGSGGAGGSGGLA